MAISFKPGQKIVCIDPERTSLTKGKEYVALAMKGSCVYILDDFGGQVRMVRRHTLYSCREHSSRAQDIRVSRRGARRCSRSVTKCVASTLRRLLKEGCIVTVVDIGPGRHERAVIMAIDWGYRVDLRLSWALHRFVLAAQTPLEKKIYDIM